MTEPKRRCRWPWLVLAICGGFIGLAAQPVTRVRHPRTTEKPAEPAACITIGEVCRMADIRVFGVELIPSATSPAAFRELRKAIRANDKDGLIQLMESGAVLDPKPGDQIRILDVRILDERTEGRMVSGRHAGAQVWVEMNWVVKQRGD